MKNLFRKTRFSEHFPVTHFSERFYFERTKRNHFWLKGWEGQKNLRDLRVGVAGTGGIGSNVALSLVRMGVGHIKIADPDVIETSNINRQVIANKSTVGRSKAAVCAEEMRAISDDFELAVYEEGITASNAHDFVQDLDVVFDEIDVYPLRAHLHLHEEAQKLGLPIYSAFVIGEGIHLYKFQGSSYTFHDFLAADVDQIDSPSVSFLVNKFLNPAPSYMNEESIGSFQEEMTHQGVPIFGPTTLLAHSFLVTRMVVDQVGRIDDAIGGRTPLMPKFLKVDPLEMRIQECDATELEARSRKPA